MCDYLELLRLVGKQNIMSSYMLWHPRHPPELEGGDHIHYPDQTIPSPKHVGVQWIFVE